MLVVIADPFVCSFYRNSRIYIRFSALLGYDLGTPSETPASSRLGDPGSSPEIASFLDFFPIAQFFLLVVSDIFLIVIVY